MSAALTLPARVDYAALDALYAEIKEARGDEVVIDASQVTHFGAAGLQLLVAAHKSWERDGHNFSIAAPSEKFNEHLRLLGLGPDYFHQAEMSE